MEQLHDDDRDRQGGGNPVGYLAQSEATLLAARVAAATPSSGRLLERPAGYPISMRSGSWRSTPPLTVTSSRPSSKLAEISLRFMLSGSLILRLKCP